MKKVFKNSFSLLLAFVLVFQIAGAFSLSAYAAGDDADGLKKAKLAAEFYTVKDEKPTKYEGSDVSVSFDPSSPEGGPLVGELEGGSMTVTPAAGYYITALTLCSSDTDTGTDIMGLSSADKGSAAVVFAQGAFLDENGELSTELFSDAKAQQYTVKVTMDKIPEAKDGITAEYKLNAGPQYKDYTDIIPSVGNKQTITAADGHFSYTVPEFTAPELPGWEYTGMTLVYPNGTGFDVAANDSFDAYTDFVIKLNYVLKVNITGKALAPVVYGGDYPADEDTYTVTFPDTLVNTDNDYTASVSVNYSSLNAGNNTVSFSDAVISYKGEALDPEIVDITAVDGTVTVTKAELKLVTLGNEKVYDGTPLTKTDGETVTGLVNGDTLSSVAYSGSQTVFGSSANTVSSVTLKSSDGTEYDASVNYDLKYETGTLNVLKREAKITANDSTLAYNGSAQTADGFTADKLAEGDRVASVEYTGSAAVPADGKVTVSPHDAKIVNAANEDVTASYDLSYGDGSISITSRSITVTAPVVTKYFTGSEITANEISACAVSGDGLASGDFIAAAAITGSRTYIGDTETSIADGSVIIKNAANEDVTALYTVSLEKGKLTVAPDPAKHTVTINLRSATKVYDGAVLALTDSDYSYTVSDGDTSVAVVTMNGASVGPDVGSSKVTLNTLTLYASDKKTVLNPADFNIIINDGEISITQSTMNITVENVTKTADGKAYSGTLKKTVTNSKSGMAFTVTADLVAYTDAGKKTEAKDAGSYVLAAENVVIKDPDGKAVSSDNIKVVVKNGTLTVKAADAGKDKNHITPDTGDSNDLVMWICIVAISLAVVIALAVYLVIKSRKSGNDR